MGDAQSSRWLEQGELSAMKHKSRIWLLLTILTIVVTVWPFESNLSAQALSSAENWEGGQVSVDPAPRHITGKQVFQNLVEHSHLRDHLLERYSVVDKYVVGNLTGKVYASAVVQVRYRAPDKKTFTKKSEEGSWLVRVLVLNRLIESQEETSSGRDHRDSSISPRNYSFKLLGEQQIGPYACYVVRAIPKRKDKYLFEGRIWISKRDFGIVRIAGHPSQKLSFWIERVDFVRQYRKIGLFWLPEKDATVAKIRWKGKKILTIGHSEYTINGRPYEGANAQVQPSLGLGIGFQPRTGSSTRSVAGYHGLAGVEANRRGEPKSAL